MDKSKLSKLIYLLGIPAGIETGFHIGGASGCEIVHRSGKKTGYIVYGKTGNEIISEKGEKIGSISMGGLRRVLTTESTETNYFLGGLMGEEFYIQKDYPYLLTFLK